MKRKIVPIAATALVLGVIFEWFFFGHAAGINVPLFAALLLAATLLLSAEFRHRLPRTVLAFMPLILFFAVMLAVLSSGMLAFFNIILMVYLLLLSLRLGTRRERLLDLPVTGYFQHLAGLFPASLRESKIELARAFQSSRQPGQHTSAAPVIRGIVISLPFLFLFLLLLSSADLVFKSYVTSIFSLHVNAEFIMRTLLVLFVTSIITGSYALLFMRPPVDSSQSLPTMPFKLGLTEAIILLGSVSALFLFFIVVQFAYFFGGSERVLHTSFTYAQYARQGFFELIAVAVLSALLVWFVGKSLQADSLRQIRRFKWLSAALILEVMVIMLSAHMRLSLYENTYGFTVLRLLSHLFIGWLALVFVLMLAYIFSAQREERFAFALFVSVLGFFVVLNVLNPYAFIARQNIARYHQTRKLDFSYLNNLPEDATPALATLLHDRDPEVQKTIASILYSKNQTSQSTTAHWESWNLSRRQANQVYADNAALLDTNKEHPPIDLYNNYR